MKEELQETKHEAERRVIRLEMDCRSHQQRLEVYTALEKELEETLEEAAEGEQLHMLPYMPLTPDI